MARVFRAHAAASSCRVTPADAEDMRHADAVDDICRRRLLAAADITPMMPMRCYRFIRAMMLHDAVCHAADEAARHAVYCRWHELPFTMRRR